MPKVLRASALATIVAVLAVVAPVTAGATAKPRTIAKSIGSTGAEVRFAITAKDATMCAWSIIPRIARFDHSARCSSGTQVRRAAFPTNSSFAAKDWTITFSAVRDKTPVTTKWRITEAPLGATLTAAPVSSTPTTTTTTGGTPQSGGTSTPSTPTPNLAVSLDPSFIQGNTPSTYLDVTYSFSASASENGMSLQSLPSGVLDFYNDGSLACSINVGANVSSGSCPVDYSTYGSHSVITEYISGTNSATTGAQTESITPPPISVNETWGTTSPTNTPAVSATIIGSSASVTATDSNWESPTGTVVLTDQLNDSCNLSIVGSSGTCTMSVSGTPTSFTIAYPGGATQQTTQAVSPNGTQAVTYNWVPENVTVSHPTVTVQSDTVNDNGGSVKNGSTPVSSWPSAAPNPIIDPSTGDSVRIMADTTGTVVGDTFPIGYLTVTVSGPGGYTEVNEGGFGSSDCSTLANFSSQAVGTCQLTFSSTGTYTVTWTYTSQDLNYPSGATLVDTVNVS